MSLDLGTLVAHLGLDASAVTSGATQANQAFSSVQTGSQQTGDRLDGLKKKLGAALAVGALIAFGKASVQAFAEAEQSQLKLQSAFEKFPKLADSNIAAITGIAEALAQKTQFDDDATKAAAAQLAQFNLTGKQIEEVIPLVQDYAARTGKDLPAAATSLGKAFLGQTRSLKEVGINYKSTGDSAQDYANIVDLLGDKVGGFAEKQGKTTAGQLAILENNFGELKEAVGEAILPIAGGLVDAAGAALSIITPLAGALGSVIGWFQGLPGPVKAAATALGLIAVLKLTGVLAGITSRVTAMRQSFALASYQTGTFANRLSQIRIDRTAGQVTALGGAMRLAGAGARSAGSALLGAVGGPAGLAITAGLTLITLGFSKMGSDAAKSREIAEAHKATITSFADALRESNGVLDENLRLMAIKLVQDQGGVQMAKDLGISFTDLVQAQLGQKDAQDKVRVAYEAWVAVHKGSTGIFEENNTKALTYGSIVGTLGSTLADARTEQDLTNAALAETARLQDAANASTTAAVGSTHGLAAAVAELAVVRVRSMAEQAAGLQQLSEMDADARAKALADELGPLNAKTETAARNVGALTEQLTPFAEATKEAGDQQSELADQTDRVTDALDRQAGRIPTVEEANYKASAATDGLAEAFGLGTKEAERLGDSVLDSAGKIDTGTESGRKLYDQTHDVREAMVAQAAAAYDAAVKNGDLAGASDKAAAAAQGTYDEFISSATAILGSKSAAEQLARAYGLVPKTIATKVDADTDQAAAKVAAIKKQMQNLVSGIYRAIITTVNVVETRYTQTGTAPKQGAPRAIGGSIVGPGTATSDDILIRASNGEHMLTAADVVKLGGQQGVYRFREQLQKGNVPKYATGGGIGASAFSLAGNAAPSYSGREAVTRGAIDDLLDAFKDLVDAAADAADEVRDTSKAYREAKVDLNEARHDRNAATSQARADIREAERDRAKAVQVRRAAQSAVEKADAAVAKKRTTETVKAAREAAKDLTDARSDENKQIRHLAATQRAFNRVRSEEAGKVRQATVALNAASTAASNAAAAKTRADAAAAERRRDLQATTAARTVLVGLARAADQTAGKLASARDRLNDLRDSSAQMASSVAGSISGFGGGILGNSEQRQTGADVLRGLRFNESKVVGFGKNIDRLRSLGLSPALLEQIASAGVDGGGGTAAALAKSTPQMLRQINASVARTNAAAARTGKTVADANFAKPIAGLTTTVHGLADQLKGLRNLDDRIASAVRGQFEVIGGVKGLALLVREGEKKIGRTG